MFILIREMINSTLFVQYYSEDICCQNTERPIRYFEDMELADLELADLQAAAEIEHVLYNGENNEKEEKDFVEIYNRHYECNRSITECEMASNSMESSLDLGCESKSNTDEISGDEDDKWGSENDKDVHTSVKSDNNTEAADVTSLPDFIEVP